jgi:hypothetical protein
MWKTKILLVEQTISLAPCRFVLAHQTAANISLIHVFNKYFPRSDAEKEFDVPGVHGKLLKYTVHSSE